MKVHWWEELKMSHHWVKPSETLAKPTSKTLTTDIVPSLQRGNKITDMAMIQEATSVPVVSQLEGSWEGKEEA
jgi:hypothetical protein